MKTNITQALVDEHRLILRMIALLERNARLTAAGEYTDWRFYLDGIDFIRTYADRFHHAKEEDVLFKALIDNGMPARNSPVAAMLMEHDRGRAHVKALEAAVHRAQAGEPDQEGSIAEHALAYAGLLREHIDKEDTVLYPLAERILPETARPGILETYAVAEQQAPDLTARYAALVAGYEREAL